ncbi:DUF998 domain-containing protein [Streptomyces sp. NPDC005551]|uniref:DUF998 domain-containing protein n=1 Tax=Streptomyces sp. NPDC005551 TaxID=3364725 RepID=UPI003697321A
MLTYTAWALEAVLPTGLAPTRTYVSELAAQDQPRGGLFRTTDLVAGTLLWAGGLWALLRLPRPSRWATAGWTALLLFGAATAVDSRLPLSCAATVDRRCAEREHAGLVPVTHLAHTMSSALALCCALAAMAALTRAARHAAPRAAPTPEPEPAPEPAPSPLARLGPPLVALELVATVWTLAAVAALEADHADWSLGLAQRAQLGLIAVWLGVLGVSLARPAPQAQAVPRARRLVPETGRAGR